MMYGQSTSGSTQPGERPVTARSGDVSSIWQHSFIGNATEEEKKNDKLGKQTVYGLKSQTEKCHKQLFAVFAVFCRMSVRGLY